MPVDCNENFQMSGFDGSGPLEGNTALAAHLPCTGAGAGFANIGDVEFVSIYGKSMETLKNIV